jgi:hypothetical protein
MGARMRFRDDHRVKALLSAALEGRGRCTLDASVSLDAQRADLAFEPDPAAPPPADLLARMARFFCLFEPFGRAPSAAELRACVGKQIAFERARRDAAGTGASGPPWLWVLCAGRPRSALAALELGPLTGWPAGVYGLISWRFGVVVLSELPTEPATLTLRLLGRGRTLARALEDLRALPTGLPAARRVLHVVVSLQAELGPAWSRALGTETIMATWDWKATYARFEAETLSKAKAQGLREGRADGLAKGKAEGLRLAIGDLCELLGVALGPKRRARLAAMSADELEALRLALKRHKRWPVRAERQLAP